MSSFSLLILYGNKYSVHLKVTDFKEPEDFETSSPKEVLINVLFPAPAFPNKRIFIDKGEILFDSESLYNVPFSL